MNDSNSYVSLKPHVKSPTVGFEVSARAFRERETLVIEYRVRGPLSALRIPGANDRLAPELWNHTCFELFLRSPGHDGYWEWNFSPTGEYNFFRFAGYRERIENSNAGTGEIVEQKFERISNSEVYMLVRLRENPPPLEASLTTVLERADGTLEYWATAHAGEKPDFHNAKSFILSL